MKKIKHFHIRPNTPTANKNKETLGQKIIREEAEKFREVVKRQMEGVR